MPLYMIAYSYTAEAWAVASRARTRAPRWVVSGTAEPDGRSKGWKISSGGR
jgi:hypothetical protein